MYLKRVHIDWLAQTFVINELASLPELLSVLQRFIDHDERKAKMMIALCGSSQQMMQSADG